MHIQKQLTRAHARRRAHAGPPLPLRYLLKALNDPSREVNEPPVASLATRSVQDIVAAGLKADLSHNHTYAGALETPIGCTQNNTGMTVKFKPVMESEKFLNPKKALDVNI